MPGHTKARREDRADGGHLSTQSGGLLTEGSPVKEDTQGVHLEWINAIRLALTESTKTAL